MRSYFFFSFVIIINACSNNTYENYHSFNNSQWNTDSIVEFRYTIIDTTKKYDLTLKVRHTVDYNFQNLFIFLEEKTKDTVEINLANKNGKWLGNGIGDVREFTYFIEKEREFHRKGEYKIAFEQAMRYGSEQKIVDLQHILDIGLKVVEHNE